MTARRTSRKAANVDISTDDLDLDAIVTVPTEADPVMEDEPTVEAPAPSTARKYMSHANCTHARKGEAGKVARAQCRRDIKAWLKAELDYVNELSDVAV